VDEGGFERVVQDVQRFARRRPILFIGLAAAAGFAVTRIGRNLAGDGQEAREGAYRSRLTTVPALASRPAPPVPEPVFGRDAGGPAPAVPPEEYRTGTTGRP
jgi:hypothetical protein